MVYFSATVQLLLRPVQWLRSPVPSDWRLKQQHGQQGEKQELLQVEGKEGEAANAGVVPQRGRRHMQEQVLWSLRHWAFR